MDRTIDRRLVDSFRLVEEAAQARQIPGAVAGVLHHGETVAESCCGLAHTDPSIPMTAGTIFDLASLTKVVATVSAVALMAQEVLLDLDDPVHRFLPAFHGDGREQILVRHLLSHTAGLPATRAYADHGLTERQEILNDICQIPLGQPGGPIVYSDLGFMLLGWVVEAMAEQPLDRLLTEQVFEPLGMCHTTYNPPVSWRERCAATEYRPLMHRHQWGEVHDRNAGLLGGVSGHAGLFSTIDDLTKWARAFFWPAAGGVFQPAMAHRALTPLAHDDTQVRAWGWIVNGGTPCSLANQMSANAVGHTGFTGTGIWYDPRGDWAAILLTNRVHFGRAETATSIARLRRVFLDSVAEALS